MISRIKTENRELRAANCDLTSPAFKANPHPFYARLREEAPVYRFRWFMGMHAWVVSRYEDVLTVLKDDRFSKAYVQKMPFVPGFLRKLTRNVLNMDPPDHTRLRTLVNKAFTPRVVERLRPRIEELCDELIERAAGRGSMELVRDFALLVPLTVIGDLLGVPANDRGEFSNWSKSMVGADSGRPRDLLSGFYGMWRYGAYFRKHVARRRNDPRDDLATALIEAEEAGDRLDEQELVAMLGILLFAGYETTVNLIASGALALMQHPEQRELLQDNLESAVEELLRFTSPADFATPRVAKVDVEIAGTTIPKGAIVMGALGSANRDASQFRDPDKLDLTREPNRHLAFGMGAHFCVGAPLARLEGQIALSKLFARFPKMRVASEPLQWRKGLIVRGLEALPVTL